MKKFILLIFCLFFITGCGPVVFGNNQNKAVLTPLELANFPAKVIYKDKKEVVVPDAVKLTFFGDLMLDRNVKKRIDEHGVDYIFEKLYSKVSTSLFASDIIHANLEGPFADKRRATTKSIAFRFDPILISTFKKYGFNIFDVANNHSLDMGQAGLKESEKNLSAAGIEYYGDGYGIGDNAVKIKEVNGIKIAFVGLNDTYFKLDEKKIVELIRKAKCLNVIPTKVGIQSTTISGLGSRLPAGRHGLRGNDSCVEITIVNIHWGEEYKTISNTRQRELAHAMVDAGADVIIGHHPHVVEEMEIYNNRPIFYSLGNFVFDQYFSTDTQQGLAVKMNFEKGKLVFSVFPLQSIQSQVALMNATSSEKFFTAWVANNRLNGYNFDSANTLQINL